MKKLNFHNVGIYDCVVAINELIDKVERDEAEVELRKDILKKFYKARELKETE